jgi:hypothetical protein
VLATEIFVLGSEKLSPENSITKHFVSSVLATDIFVLDSKNLSPENSITKHLSCVLFIQGAAS